ncbi:unnamed protein product, partial [Urochloa humidicola]
KGRKKEEARRAGRYKDSQRSLLQFLSSTDSRSRKKEVTAPRPCPSRRRRPAILPACCAMPLRSPTSTPRRDLGPRDSPPADSPAPTSQGGSSNGAKADVARKTNEEAGHLLAKLEKEGLEIDGKIACIIDDGIARIKAEAERENFKTKVMVLLVTFASAAIGFVKGMEWTENTFRKEFAKRRRA